MVVYNWSKVYKEADRRPAKILEILRYITERPIPKNDNDYKVLQLEKIDWDGQSFLVNPKPVYQHRKFFSDKELAEYVALASFRSLAEYKVTKQKTLRVSECPVTLDSIKENKLLTIVGDKIYFKWEETTH